MSKLTLGVDQRTIHIHDLVIEDQRAYFRSGTLQAFIRQSVREITCSHTDIE